MVCKAKQSRKDCHFNVLWHLRFQISDNKMNWEINKYVYMFLGWSKKVAGANFGRDCGVFTLYSPAIDSCLLLYLTCLPIVIHMRIHLPLTFLSVSKFACPVTCKKGFIWRTRNSKRHVEKYNILGFLSSSLTLSSQLGHRMIALNNVLIYLFQAI